MKLSLLANKLDAEAKAEKAQYNQEKDKIIKEKTTKKAKNVHLFQNKKIRNNSNQR